YDYQVCTIACSNVPFVNGDPKEISELSSNKRQRLPSINLHEADFSQEWRTIIDPHLLQRYETNANTNRNVTLLSEECIITQRVIRSTKNTNILKPELALRICALRCLFRELGK